MGRPDGTTMEGMIWNAHHILEKALDPKQKGIPKWLFRKCVGVVLVSVVEVGFIFSGHVGTGIILGKKEGGGWSMPSACGMTGVGWGFLFGASIKEVIVFIFDEETLKSMSTRNGLKLGSQAEITFGPIGRSFDSELSLSGKGVGSTFSVSFSKGGFIGLSIEGAVVGARNACNEAFYGQKVSASEILTGAEGVAIPENKVTLLNEVYAKLDKLSEGETAETAEEDEAKKNAAKEAADKAAEEVKNDPDIVQVNAAEEAAKEEK